MGAAAYWALSRFGTPKASEVRSAEHVGEGQLRPCGGEQRGSWVNKQASWACLRLFTSHSTPCPPRTVRVWKSIQRRGHRSSVTKILCCGVVSRASSLFASNTHRWRQQAPYCHSWWQTRGLRPRLRKSFGERVFLLFVRVWSTILSKCLKTFSFFFH